MEPTTDGADSPLVVIRSIYAPRKCKMSKGRCSAELQVFSCFYLKTQNNRTDCYYVDDRIYKATEPDV